MPASGRWPLNFTFERLISIDLVLYGSSLLLEFVALPVLRRREPALPRPFRVPGGMAGAILAGIGPALLIFFAMYAARNERVWGLNALLFAALVGVSGAVVYALKLQSPEIAIATEACPSSAPLCVLCVLRVCLCLSSYLVISTL